jgi:hypothetical protein
LAFANIQFNGKHPVNQETARHIRDTIRLTHVLSAETPLLTKAQMQI